MPSLSGYFHFFNFPKTLHPSTDNKQDSKYTKPSWNFPSWISVLQTFSQTDKSVCFTVIKMLETQVCFSEVREAQTPIVCGNQYLPTIELRNTGQAPANWI